MNVALLLLALAQTPEPSMADRVRRFVADEESLGAKYRVELADRTAERLAEELDAKLAELRAVDFAALDTDGQVDAILLRAEIEHRQALLARDAASDARAAELLRPAMPMVALAQDSVTFEPVDPKAAAAAMRAVTEAVTAEADRLNREKPEPPGQAARVDGLWAARRLGGLREDLAAFHRFRDGYDPEYTWWCGEPYKRVDDAISKYRTALREHVVGVPDSDEDTILGVPIGAEGLEADLRHEFIAYEPAELLDIARRELAWCEARQQEAAAELGFDDWRDAQNAVKNDYAPPGKQDELIVELALEATKFVEDRDLVTVPALCKETWRTSMLSAEQQRVSPFFLGGPVIQIAAPTEGMTHAEKLMTLRGNNRHFARATVHHELIPGHHLQIFMNARHRPHRLAFRTPFWIEGWALYWEMRFWDLNFARTPQEELGMLFWRKHRCARILFSLAYHTGEMTPAECVDFLIETVGFERKNATSEVRRSVMGGYSPLYQAAYMLGGLQLRALHEEVVGAGKMTEREFHDYVLKQNAIPFDLIRAQLLGQELTLDRKAAWRF